MAIDWIKMRTDLYRDPKVCILADYISDPDGDLSCYVNQNMQRNMTVTRNVMRNAVVGALLSVWGVMRHRGKSQNGSLVCNGVTIHVIDDIADMNGFGEAMEAVGWVVQTDDGIVFPSFFDEHNVDPKEKSDTKNAERQKRYRDKKNIQSNADSNVTSNVTHNVTVTHREEKRREENIYPTPTAAPSSVDQIFAINHHWTPSPDLQARAGLFGLKPSDITADRVGEFISYWSAQTLKRSQAQWDHALLKAIKRHTETAKANPKAKISDSISFVEKHTDTSWAAGVIQ